MGLRIEPGRIRITDGANTRFDTNDGYFHILSKVNGSISIPPRGIVATFNNTYPRLRQTNVYNLGSVDPGCNAVFGVIKLTYTGQQGEQGLSANAWFSISGGGSYMHVWDTISDAGPIYRASNVQQLVVYHFSVAGSGSGRHISLKEDVRLYLDVRPPQGAETGFSVRGFTMDYRLRAGAFT